MKEERIEELFRGLQGTWDTEEPLEGHEERFRHKLESRKQRVMPLHSKTRKWLRPLAIAASVIFLCLLGIQVLAPAPSINEQVAKISPEIAKTEFYFASLIEEQVRDLENESTPETKQLIDDTLLQLKKLEANYRNLEQDLLKGGNSKLILSAMITNFQTRIDLLQEVMDTIDTIKNLNPHEDEKYTI